MGNHNCETCKFRAKYDANARSFLGRLWRWHAGWCPGFKAYMKSLAPEDRNQLAVKYNLKKYQQTA